MRNYITFNTPSISPKHFSIRINKDKLYPVILNNTEIGLSTSRQSNRVYLTWGSPTYIAGSLKITLKAEVAQW